MDTYELLIHHGDTEAQRKAKAKSKSEHTEAAEGTEMASKYRGDCPKLRSVSMLKSSGMPTWACCSNLPFFSGYI
jgi:hypothetical protein